MKALESLERRQLFAADPFFTLTSKGTLIVNGTEGNDSIAVSFGKDQKFTVRITTASNDVGLYYQAKLLNAAVKRFFIDGGNGDDTIGFGLSFDPPRPATLLGGEGNDNIGYGNSGALLMDGGAGDDVVGRTTMIHVTSKKNRDVLNDYFASGVDGTINTVLGSEGDDTVCGDGNDQIDGGNGNDTARVNVGANSTPIPADRRDAIAHDFFARIGAQNIETTLGLSL